MTKKKKPTLFVSSTIYGSEELLNQLYSVLKSFGYEVWMSHKGSFFVPSDKPTFGNCLRAVKECDLFLGIITPSYGSGKEAGKLSITHQEMQLAIKLDKPRWLLAHADVVFARRLLIDLEYDTPDKRKTLQLKKGAKSITDLRVIDMYEEAIRHDEPELEKRTGNWVQEFNFTKDVLEFAESQFSDIERILPLIKKTAAAKPKPAKVQPRKRKGGAK